jgi:hypothetical protein
VRLLRHQQTKRPVTDKPHLHDRATSRLYPIEFSCSSRIRIAASLALIRICEYRFELPAADMTRRRKGCLLTHARVFGEPGDDERVPKVVPTVVDPLYAGRLESFWRSYAADF